MPVYMLNLACVYGSEIEGIRESIGILKKCIWQIISLGHIYWIICLKIEKFIRKYKLPMCFSMLQLFVLLHKQV